ncbi:MAG: PhzF family phenazine biosynthesis protein [Chitinophagaceae bacterium]|nr:PhzF family phenazine biosynthesis protein [Chitinophagaceae bacterium]
MKLTLYQVDAFTNKLFGGNPAAVVPLDKWIDDTLMQQIAMENNLAETVFFVPQKEDYHIRWFTPELEIDLCGHATLAASYVLYQYLGVDKPQIRFHSKSGELLVQRKGDKLELNFPARMPELITSYPDELLKGLGVANPVAVYKSRDYVVELETQKQVEQVKPDMGLLNKIDVIGIIITAPGTDCDFVSRFFAPNCGIPEDPVTGSSHSTLIPFWAEKLNKTSLHARQLSQRKGELWCEMLKGDRVTMAGQCVFYMKGEINLKEV